MIMKQKTTRKNKLTLLALAAKGKVAVNWIKKTRKQFSQTGLLEPIKPKLAPYRDRLRKIVAQTPDATWVEIPEQLPVAVCLQTICNELNKLKIRYKNKASCLTSHGQLRFKSMQYSRLSQQKRNKIFNDFPKTSRPPPQPTSLVSVVTQLTPIFTKFVDRMSA